MKRLYVDFVNRNCAHVSGHGSRALLTTLRGRPPVWSTLSRAWVTVPEAARDLIAVAEARGFEVIVSDGERVDPGAGRW